LDQSTVDFKPLVLKLERISPQENEVALGSRLLPKPVAVSICYK